MPEGRTSQTESPLELYLQYDYLPVQQHAALLACIGTIHGLLLQRDLRTSSEHILPPFLRWEAWPSLVIAEARTGESLRLGFDTERHWYPRLGFQERELEILLPRWTAAVVLVGASLTVGLLMYDRFLEVQKKQLEVERLRQEIRQHYNIPADDQPSKQDSNIVAINIQTLQFQQHLLMRGNIRGAAFNGVPVPLQPLQERRE